MSRIDPGFWMALIGRSLFAHAGPAAGSLPPGPSGEPRVEIGDRTLRLPIVPEPRTGAPIPPPPAERKPPPFERREQTMGPGPFGAPHALAALVLEVLARRTRDRAPGAHRERHSAGAAFPAPLDATRREPR